MKPFRLRLSNIARAGAVCLVACAAVRGYTEPRQADGQPTYEQFVAANAFPYQAPSPRQDKLIHGYATLSVGMSKAAILGVVGPPDYSLPTYARERPAKYVSGKWVYVIAKPDAASWNEKQDRVIVIFFDRNDNAEWIVPLNMPGLAELGGPYGS
jgi:hypothetical protein